MAAMMTQQLSDDDIEKANEDALAHINALMAEAEELSESEEWQKVMSLCQQAISISTQWLGPLHICTLWHFKKKGAYLRQQGRYADAERVDRGLLAKWESKQPRDSLYELSVLDVLSNLVEDLRPQGLIDEVIVVQTQILESVLRDRGEEDEYTAVCKNKLANSLHRRGDYDEAFRLHSEALAIQRRFPEGPGIAVLLDMTAVDCLALGNGARAQVLQEEAVTVAERVCGLHDDTTVQCIVNLTGTYRKNKSQPSNWIQRLEMLAGETEINSIISADLLNTLGTEYCDAKRYCDAQSAYFKCLTWAEQNLGREHSSTKLYLRNYTYASTKTGDLVWAPIASSDVTGLPE